MFVILGVFRNSFLITHLHYKVYIPIPNSKILLKVELSANQSGKIFFYYRKVFRTIFLRRLGICKEYIPIPNFKILLKVVL